MADREPWPGPPGCHCDMSLPAKDRCTKAGMLRCGGALAAVQDQYEKRRRERAGVAAGPVDLCTTCVDVRVPPHARGPVCESVFRNASGALCGLCDGTHEHEHRGRQS